NGAILRIHVMRPTWHFVLPDDIRWMLELTASRVKLRQDASDRKLGLDDALIARSNTAIARSLEGRNYLTRNELKTILADVGIPTDVRRLAHILMRAELDGLICSGPRRGKQFTYALLDERVRETRMLDREEALAELALRYFTSHGPAQEKDFSWWSGVAIKDARSALEKIRPGLDHATFDDRTYWFPPKQDDSIPDPPLALLLPIYDEYTLAYKDRSDISQARDIERMIVRGNEMTAVIVLGGKVAGTWRKSTLRDLVEIRLNPFREPDGDEAEALELEVVRYGRFVGKEAVVVD
ncbi:MAG: hypothetical protein APR55_05565, partial [Methanolinea sp. SDB]